MRPTILTFSAMTLPGSDSGRHRTLAWTGAGTSELLLGLPLAVDLSEAGSGAAVVELAVDLLGGLDVTVHCIGINDRRPIVEFSEEDWSRIVDINLSQDSASPRSPEAICGNQKAGRIIFSASVSGLLAHRNHLRGHEGRHQPAHACDGGRMGSRRNHRERCSAGIRGNTFD
jgi:NAD(P)-dependent dehydrogenase (short-subunit alcohol dehydrogenase family)